MKMSLNCFCCIIIATISMGGQGICQLSDNTPPVMLLDRNWIIPTTEEIGAVVTRVKAQDSERDRLEFGLETAPSSPSKDFNPFRIDKDSGVVYVSESLKDQDGKNLLLYITVTDGRLTTKAEVYVNIVNATAKGFNWSGRPRVPHPIPVNPFYATQHLPGGRPSKLQPAPGKPFTGVPDGDAAYSHPSLSNGASNQGNEDLKTLLSTTISPVSIGRPPERKNKTEDEGGGEVNVGLDNGLSSIGATVVPVIIGCTLLVLFAGASAAFFHRKMRCRDPAQKDKDMRKEPGFSGALSVGFRSSASSSATTSVPLSSTDSSNGPSMQLWRSARALSNRYESWDSENGPMSGMANGRPVGNSGDTQNEDRQPPKDPWEFPRHRLRVFNILGEGCFGQVWRCEAQDINGVEGPTVVAVKTLKENSGEKERQDLLQELHIMKMLDPHPNVVLLIGCCTEKDPIFVIMEYMAGGKLQSYLRSSRAERSYGNLHGKSENLSSRDLTSFVYQVARGMQYLSSRGIIHRDLAARNVLVSANRTCKVADFGFARDIASNHVYERKSEGRLPIRWMAPESLYDNIFTTKSDVWSFGVFSWEVVTLGSTPYPGLAASDVMRKVRDGLRLEKPEHCRRELFNVMYYCWDKDPKERPTFGELVSLLEGLLLTETDYIELERFPDHCYYNVVSLSGEKV